VDQQLFARFRKCAVEVLSVSEDQVVPEQFVACCEVAFTNRVGPLIVPRAGHFLQWERADVLNGLVAGWFSQFR